MTMRDEFEKLGLFTTMPTYKEIAWEGFKAAHASRDEEVAALKAELERYRSFHKWDGKPHAVTDTVWIEPGRLIHPTEGETK